MSGWHGAAEPPPVKASSPGPLPHGGRAPESGAPMTMPPAGPPPRSRSRNSIEIDVDANVGIVRPGDKLVVATCRQLDLAEAEQMQRQLAENLPGVEAIILSGADSLVVYRGER